MDRTPTLSAAVVVWTGWDSRSLPSRDERQLAAQFGEDAARALLPQLRALEQEFYSSDAVRVSADLREMGERAATQFRGRHPELSEEAVQALAWCYTYDFK